MKYVIADIHGCYESYVELLCRIGFSEERDWLYILGDAVDRGPEPMKILLDLAGRKNVTFIIGNHDYVFFYFLQKMSLNFSGTKHMSKEDESDFLAYMVKDGGLSTVEKFQQLTEEEKRTVYEYLKEASVYEVIEAGGKKYVLAHAGICGFEPEKKLEEYDLLDFICDRADYQKRYFPDPDTFLVTGHTPTMCIRPDFSPEIYMGNGHIAVDCGCVYGGRLAAYCIETGEVVYVEGELSW